MDASTVLGLFGNAASGGLIGAVGGLISKGLEAYNSYKVAQVQLEQSKAQFTHEEKMQELNNATLEMEITANLKSIATEAQMAYDQASFSALKSSYDADKASYATGDTAKNSPWFIFVDFVRGITRPFLTWGLDLAALTIVVYLMYILKDTLPLVAATKGIELLTDTVNAVFFMASTATTYWFASRPHNESGGAYTNLTDKGGAPSSNITSATQPPAPVEDAIIKPVNQ